MDHYLHLGLKTYKDAYNTHSGAHAIEELRKAWYAARSSGGSLAQAARELYAEAEPESWSGKTR